MKNICSTPLENLIQEEDNFKATDVRFITKDLLNKYKTLIEDKNSLNEFNEHKKVAIVGSRVNNVVVNENGKEYIKVFDEQYEVVGKINKTDYLADTIFIPIESSIFYNRSYSSFTFFIADDEINTLKNILPKVYVEDIPEKSLIEAIINSPNVKDNILNLVLGIINLMLFSIFYCEKIKKKLAIMKVLGANNKHIFNDIIIMFLKFSSISFVIGIGLSYITTNLLNNYFGNMLTSVNLTNILLTLAFILITSILVSMFTLFNIIKFDIIKEIR